MRGCIRAGEGMAMNGGIIAFCSSDAGPMAEE
jgi:hypothetical protein